MSLTAKRQAFVDEYLVDLNATQAAIRAGYSKKTAAQIGEQNLRKLEISSAIDSAKEARSERTQITSDMVVTELAKLAFTGILDYMKFDDDDKLILNKVFPLPVGMAESDVIPVRSERDAIAC